jgi:hypothetical protein
MVLRNSPLASVGFVETVTHLATWPSVLYFFLWWRAPQQMLRTHRSLKAYCATLWWRWLVFYVFPCNGVPVEWNWQGKTEVLGGETCPSDTLSTINLTRTDPGRTRASAVRGRRLTAWATARPFVTVSSRCCVRSIMRVCEMLVYAKRVWYGTWLTYVLTIFVSIRNLTYVCIDDIRIDMEPDLGMYWRYSYRYGTWLTYVLTIFVSIRNLTYVYIDDIRISSMTLAPHYVKLLAW